MNTNRRLEELQDYDMFPPTESCYLDGRYFNLVLKRLYPGIVENPLIVSVAQDGKQRKFRIEMREAFISSKHPCFIRVIIQSAEMRHSALLMIDLAKKQGWYWNPRSYDEDNVLDLSIYQKISEFLRNGLGVQLTRYNLRVPDDENPNCALSGYCNAYVIKFVLDWLLDVPPSFENIRSFCTMIEEEYGDKLTGEEDVEYQFSPGGALLGGAGGALLGTAVAGPAGGLALGTTGALAGGFIF